MIEERTGDDITQNVMDAYSVLIRKKSLYGCHFGGSRFVRREVNGEKVLVELADSFSKEIVYPKLKFA